MAETKIIDMHVTQKITILVNEVLGEAGLKLHTELIKRGWENEQQAKAILPMLTFMVMAISHPDINKIYHKAHLDALPAMLKWKEFHENEFNKLKQ